MEDSPEHRSLDERYGRVTNPERYLVLHEVARHEIRRLSQRQLVERTDGTDLDPHARSMWPGSPATRLDSTDGGAPLTVTFTPFPGLVVRFGHAGTDAFPSCGCDACDESPSDEVDRFLALVADVVAGRLTEHRVRRLGRSDRYEHELRGADGDRSMTSGAIASADAAAVPHGISRWPPWSPSDPDH